MVYIVVLLLLAVAIIIAILAILFSMQESKPKGVQHRRSQTSLGSEPSDSDIRQRQRAPSNRTLPSQPKLGAQSSSQLLSDRLVADQRSLEEKLKSGHFSTLQMQIEDLANQGWAKTEAAWHAGFILAPKTLENITEPAEVVTALLKHAKRTTPEFSVPWIMTPHTVVETTPNAAGRFVVGEEGWVTIKLSPQFFDNRAAAQAILAHEACHYILENFGFREEDIALNERYTDIFMFICGFGQLFLNGYKQSSSQHQYRPGHRLGYLTDSEYDFIHQYVGRLRNTYQKNLQSALAVNKKELLGLVHGNQAIMKRLVAYERDRTPDKDEAKLYENAIYRLRRH